MNIDRTLFDLLGLGFFLINEVGWARYGNVDPHAKI